MEINGVNLDNLDAVAPASLVPDVVQGRELQLDGDMLVYECSGYDDEPFNMCVANFKAALQSRMAVAAAEFCTIHLTGGNKGGRFEIAQVKEYQGNRKDKVKPAHLPALRAWVMDTYINHDYKAQAVMHEDQEADDGIAQAQYDAIKKGNTNLSIIMSADKDLTMCSGLHCDWNSYQIHEVTDFGSIYLDDSGSSKKIRGFGTSFFWAQLLMGDTADAIPGLPLVGMPLLDEVAPISKPRKPGATKQVGAVMAMSILDGCVTDLQCMKRVIEAYQSYYGTGVFNFTTWRGDTIQVTSGHMVLEQAKLLWMRRTKDECPSVFFKQVVQGKGWTE